MAYYTEVSGIGDWVDKKRNCGMLLNRPCKRYVVRTLVCTMPLFHLYSILKKEYGNMLDNIVRSHWCFVYGALELKQ